MTVSSFVYYPNTDLGKAGVVFTTDTIKAMLLSAYTPSQANQFLSDVLLAGTEASGSGYTAGGATLGTKTDTTSGAVTTLTAAAPVWTTSNPGSLAAAYVVFYKSTGTSSTSPVLFYWDLGGTATATNGGTFTVTPNGSGLLTFTGV